MVLFLLSNIWPSYGQKMTRMPIFGHTFFGPLGGPFRPTAISKSCFRSLLGWPPLKEANSIFGSIDLPGFQRFKFPETWQLFWLKTRILSFLLRHLNSHIVHILIWSYYIHETQWFYVRFYIFNKLKQQVVIACGGGHPVPRLTSMVSLS